MAFSPPHQHPQPYQEFVGENQSIVREARPAFIDRSKKTEPLGVVGPSTQVQVVDSERDGFQPVFYEENNAAAQLYNPFSGNLLQQNQSLRLPPPSGLYETKQSSIPINSAGLSPVKDSPGYGRMLGSKERKLLTDPVDIDDDVSDHGGSMEQQLKELEGANKYLQNIRVPTSKSYSGNGE